MQLTRTLTIVVLAALVLLTACGGGSGSPASHSANSSSAPVSITMGDTPPAGVAVLSFEITVASATLQPGNVPVVTNPIRIEMTKLETENAFLNTAGVAAGNYTGITVTFANPELTIKNSSAAAIGSCAVGATCELKPALSNTTVSFTGAPFPLTLSAGSPMGLLLDFDVQNSIQSTLAINPTISLTQLPAVQATGKLDDLDDIVGQVTAKDAANNQFTLQVGGSQGQSFTITVDSNTEFGDFEEEGMSSGFAALAVNQFVKVSLKLMSGGAMVAKEVELAESHPEGEFEGEISSVVSPTQFKMVINEEESAVAGVQVGNEVVVNIQSGATFAICKDKLSIPSGVSFAGGSDLMIGQHVQIRPTGAPSSTTPLTVSTDRVRLRISRMTARVSSISGANMVLDNLPALFTTASPAITQLQVQTSSQTDFEHVSGISGLAAGDTVSVAGLLFKSSSTPTVVAKKVRKR
jgi:Domain of unknown function (DUF5666)